MLFANIWPDPFNWPCANVLIGVGDSFSTSGAEVFESAAKSNGIDICMKANYKPGSSDMKAPIKRIMANRCCLVTVVFGQDQDISSLLLEAHKQNYKGEWVMSENVIGGLDGIIGDLKKHLDESSIHKLLRGTLKCISKVVLWCVPIVASHRHTCVIITSVCKVLHVDTKFCRLSSTQTHNCIIFRTIFRHFHGVSQASQKQGIPRL